MDQWLALLEAAAALHRRQGSTLLVIDSLAQFLPAHCENSAGALLECLTPLQSLAAPGMCVLLPHHPRKGKTVPGQAARGSGALPSFVDVIIEMSHAAEPDDLDRRRRLVAFSRHNETPRHLLIELLADGTDYVVLQAGPEAALGENWQGALDALTMAQAKLTRQEILDDWPESHEKPQTTTLWRWLSRAVAQGVIRQDGTGLRHDPFRYWLPAREEMLRPDGGTPQEMQAWNVRCLAEYIERLERKMGVPTVQDSDLSPDENPPPAAPAQQMETPPSCPGPETSASPSLSPAAEPLPQLPEPVPPSPSKLVLRLPFPFCMMNPAEVPEEVWQRARAAK
jgi:hypothetical protein